MDSRRAPRHRRAISPTLEKLIPAAGGVALIFGIAFAWMLFKTVTANDVGEACQNNDCDGIFGEYCVFDEFGGFCAPQCESAADCPESWACERPTEVNQYGAESTSSVSFCMRSHMLSSGTATVSSTTGAMTLAPGSLCSWTQVEVPPDTGFDCQWTVRCGPELLYGGEGGYNPLGDPSWPEGARVYDPNTTSNDGDASLVFSSDGITIRDDASGAHGEFTAVLAPR